MESPIKFPSKTPDKMSRRTSRDKIALNDNDKLFPRGSYTLSGEFPEIGLLSDRSSQK